MREAMGLGTAGFTAALSLYRMEANGQTPAMGPVVVTGASGFVGGVLVPGGFGERGIEGKVAAIRSNRSSRGTSTCI